LSDLPAGDRTTQLGEPSRPTLVVSSDLYVGQSDEFPNQQFAAIASDCVITSGEVSDQSVDMAVVFNAMLSDESMMTPDGDCYESECESTEMEIVPLANNCMAREQRQCSSVLLSKMVAAKVPFNKQATSSDGKSEDNVINRSTKLAKSSASGRQDLMKTAKQQTCPIQPSLRSVPATSVSKPRTQKGPKDGVDKFQSQFELFLSKSTVRKHNNSKLAFVAADATHGGHTVEQQVQETSRFVTDENSSKDVCTVKPTNNAKCRKLDKKYFCLYCNTAGRHLPRHVYAHHAEEREVCEIMTAVGRRKSSL
jgi:hypothetical protein